MNDHGLLLCVVGDWQKTFEEKLSPLFSVKETLSEEEAAKMGRKDPEQEVEKFVSANTQELGKDKWLCPLSGKKFKVRDIRFSLQKYLPFFFFFFGMLDFIISGLIF